MSEKYCSLYTDYSRKEASESGFCSDCKNTNCPYNTTQGRDKSNQRRTDDFSAMERENREKRNKNREKKFNKKTFKRHSDCDEW